MLLKIWFGKGDTKGNQDEFIVEFFPFQATFVV